MERASTRSTKRVWESVEIYTVRCANCSKWRRIPSKDKYEEIREIIMQRPFSCETAREWRPDISCEDPGDVEQDNTRFRWAMDRPKIPKTPNAWQRIIRIRAEGGTKFADVYYVAPSNKRFRSMVELSRYLDENPKYHQEGISLSQFSFQPPVPFDENYVGKRRAISTSATNQTSVPLEVNPIKWITPHENATNEVEALLKIEDYEIQKCRSLKDSMNFAMCKAAN